MIDTIFSFLDEFRHNFRIADAIDILLMSVILYSALQISIDLSRAQIGSQQITLNESNLNLPPHFEVYLIDPRNVRLTVRSKTQPALPAEN